jgi:hypothetical protein
MTEVLPVLPSAHALEPAVVRELEALVGRKMTAPAKRIGQDLPGPVRFSAPLEEPCWWEESPEKWWLAVPRALDPAAAQHGGAMPTPPEVCERIMRLAASPEFDCDDVVVVHEMPPGLKPGEPIPDLVPKASPRLSGEKVVELSALPLRLARTALEGMAVASLAVGSAALLTGAGVAGAAALDPILLGGVRHPELPLVGWQEIARWAW